MSAISLSTLDPVAAAPIGHGTLAAVVGDQLAPHQRQLSVDRRLVLVGELLLGGRHHHDLRIPLRNLTGDQRLGACLKSARVLDVAASRRRSASIGRNRSLRKIGSALTNPIMALVVIV